MNKGIVYALLACFLWGLDFIIPGFLVHFSPIEIALGRYLTYGTISLILIYRTWSQGGFRYPRTVWIKSLFYSLMITVGYYICLIMGVRYATPAISALVMGLSPIAISFYGNWKQKEVTYRSLITPSILILIGLFLINAPHLQTSASPQTHLWGLFYSALALLVWSWYVVANARFLKQNPTVNSYDWNNLIGVMSIFWVVLVGFALQNQINLNSYSQWSTDLKYFITGCLILGILCSSIAEGLWNKASLSLPVSLAGQLTIFETIFGVLFYYILLWELPPLLESIGIVLFLWAITLGIRRQTVFA
ncbi:MAG: DMT family transporter [Rhabdochlamydiaceae bacterium]|nr:DMT family transporter [Rhabdochlamydiaceae bacterium]